MIRGRQPICKGIDSNGELIWGSKPVPKWQKALVSIAVRLAGMMCPGTYKGDFGAHWYKVKTLWDNGCDIEADSMRLLNRVYGPLATKYEELKKKRDQRGD